MDLMPIGIRIAGLPVLVAGGGPVALRKIRLLLKCGAKIFLVSPEAHPALRRLATARKLKWIRRAFSPRDVASIKPRLAVACTSSGDVNEQVARLASRVGAWVNRADCPPGSTAHVPSVTAVGGVTIALFSGGRAPAFVKHIRRRIEQELRPGLKTELATLARIRTDLRKQVAAQPDRRKILNRILNDGLLSRLAALPAATRKRSILRLVREVAR